jgi:hypothetical protein
MSDEPENNTPSQDPGNDPVDAEGNANDRDDAGQSGDNRPRGTRTSEETTGINADDEEPIDPESTAMPPA